MVFQGHFPGLPVMPGVIQVEALAQTMAVYVAKQPGFGDRIGLFAGIDDCRFKRIVVPGDVLRLEITMEKLGGRFGRGARRRERRRRGRLRGDAQLHHPERRSLVTRLAMAAHRGVVPPPLAYAPRGACAPVLGSALRCTTLASRGSDMTARVAVLSDVHGNATALDAVRKAIRRSRTP